MKINGMYFIISAAWDPWWGGRCQPGLNQHGNRHEHRHWVDREAEDVCHCVGLRQITNPEKLSPRNSTALRSIVKKPKKTGS